MDQSGDEQEIVQTIVALGQKLRMDLVAKGIEPPTQLNRLRAMGCQRGQGYLFSQPLGRDVATALLTNPRPRASFGAPEEQPETAKKA